MFKTVLIANRGEIACRIIRTARRMGLETVAVYSDADADARHVRLADMAVRIGPAEAADSYLNADAILAAASRTGAGAIHPGYGFLSENPDFVEQVTAAGRVFVGPSATAIRAMGLKDAAKRRMEQAGVPVVPGYHGDDQAPDTLAQAAARIGYPVLIKARAGGGGKGMRRVDTPQAFGPALEAARREALAAFGDAACIVERYVERPRHIEVQVFGDSHGQVVHLFERDCSLQRRHQKVIEEAPAPGMTPQMRQAMGAEAVRAAQTIGYCGAGTVEFIVDASDGLRPDCFWFMEMNTRLQVEHPVTEAVTGLDLVEWQFRVAAGAPLPLGQDAIALRGHAVEARLYAETPERGFLPATGRITALSWPHGIRVDAGVDAGDAIGPHYDPMIAKLIAHAGSRKDALLQLNTALGELRLSGPATNRAFLRRLVSDAEFTAARFDTGLIERRLAELAPPREAPPQAVALAALALSGLLDRHGPAGPFRELPGFRLFGKASLSVQMAMDNRTWQVSLIGGGSAWRVASDDWETHVDIRAHGWPARICVDGVDMTLHGVAQCGTATIFLAGEGWTARTLLGSGAQAMAPEEDAILSPLPGTVRRVTARAGQDVAKGAPLVIVEAMKMEHQLTAPREGVVESVHVAEGDQAADGMLLVRLAARGGTP